MTVAEFIKEYETGIKKTNYKLEKHVILKYLPHTKKVALVKGVIDASSYVEVDGKKMYRRNTPTKIFLFSMRLISEYTDIEINNADVVNEYDALVSSGAMDSLLSCIDEKELNILKGLLDFVQDDLETNTRSLVSFLETKFDSANIAFNTILGVLDRPDIKAKIEEILDTNK